jgi:hypothetical protein
MKKPELFKITRGTRVVISITLGVCGTAVLIAALYYRSLNRAADPRTLPVREMIQRGSELSAARKAAEAHLTLDSALQILNSLPGYSASYERGVVYNNACSAWLLSALYDSTLAFSEKKSMLAIARTMADSSLRIYRKWISDWGSLSGPMIRSAITPWFPQDEPAFSGLNPEKILVKRIKEIQESQKETPRRLSVSLTNLGIIHRHLNQPDSALACYAEALQIWKDNRTALSNLTVLQGGKPLKPSLIQNLFPPDKKNQ